MNDLTIICPSCNTPIPLSEAITRPIRERLTQDLEANRKLQEKALADREQKLREAQAALNQARSTLDEQVQKKVAEEKAGLLATVRRQVEDKLGAEMTDLQARLEEQKRQLIEAREAELGLRKRQRQLEDQKQTLELEVARKISEERSKITEQVRAHVAEEQRLRLAEKEKLIGDLQRQIHLLNQKAEQGSVQLQGEVLELDLEDRLRAMFPSDLIEPIAKGVRGADVLQHVRTNAGLDCGSILWETKRTKAFGKDWTAKLKEDQRAAHADLAVIVTQSLPPEVKSFGSLDGIWICQFACALPLAAALRQGIVSLGVARQAEAGKHGKMEHLFQYLCGLEFRQRIEALVESFMFLKGQIDQEKRALTKHWAAREKQLESMVANTVGLYGSIQGIVGQNTLPEIKRLRLELQDETTSSSDATPIQEPLTT